MYTKGLCKIKLQLFSTHVKQFGFSMAMERTAQTQMEIVLSEGVAVAPTAGS